MNDPRDFLARLMAQYRPPEQLAPMQLGAPPRLDRPLTPEEIARMQMLGQTVPRTGPYAPPAERPMPPSGAR